MATLYVLQGPDKGRTFHTPNEAVMLGRDSENVPLTDRSISHVHAEIRPDNGAWILEDRRSSNGTYLNGQRIDGPTVLHHGDQVRLGSTLLVFSGEDTVEQFSGSKITRDVLELDATSATLDSSILSTVPLSDDSVILAAPETADAVHAWKVMYHLADAIGSITDTDELLQRVTDIIFQHLTVDRVFVLMRDTTGGEMSPQVVRYRVEKKGEKAKITTSRTIVNHVIDTKEGILCANAMTDDRFVNKKDMTGSVFRLGLSSVICVPILAHDEVDGVIHMDCSMSHHTYTNEQLRLASAIGRMTGLAIENARLIESRMANERLAAVGETVAYISHRVRNILQGLRSGTDVLELGLRRKNLETIASAWQIIQTNLDRTYQLTTNMLTFSANRQPSIVMGNLNRVVEDAIELMQRKADSKGVMLLADVDELPAIPLDAEGIHQVACNLISNAIDAAPEKTGRVTVSTEYDTNRAEAILTIADNGAGLEKDKIEAVFKPFESTKGHGGTGLGLPAARKIIDECRGKIEVESTPGEGATFHVRLPAAAVKLEGPNGTHGVA